MFISDIRKEFYDVISKKRVLILAHCDIDGVCSSKILQSLFRADHILYTLCPVQTKTDLVSSYQQHSDQVKHVVILNCGGCLDLVDLLQPREDVIFFLADNHRPLDICNIYNDGQIRILTKLGDEEEVPAFNDVFREDESDEDDSDEEGRPRLDEAALEKKRERRIWEQQRHKLLFDYSQFSYYGSATSVLFFDLAWKLSKDSNELLWWAIIGETEQLMNERTDQDKYVLTTATLQNHVSRLNHKSQDESSLDTLRITFEKELQLSLYRHWSLIESMRHTPYTSTTFKLWTLKGEKKLHELFAEMGMPLNQCRQVFSGMDVSLRNELLTMLESKAEKYGIENIIFVSFCLSLGFRSKISATDSLYSAVALLESPDNDKKHTDAFLDAVDCLNLTKNSEMLDVGLNGGKQQLIAVCRQVQTFLDMNQVVSAGPFLYATVIEGSPDARYFCNPHCLSSLARFTLKSHVAMSRSKKAKSLPLIITTPDLKAPEPGICLVCGIPPLAEDSRRNFFGKAFEQAADKTGSRAELDFFDSNIIRLAVEDRSKFFDALISLLS